MLDYKNLSVEQKKIEVLEDELPKGAIVVDKREKKDPVYGGWTYQNKDGRQFVVIAAGGHWAVGSPASDHLIAFALSE